MKKLLIIFFIIFCTIGLFAGGSKDTGPTPPPVTEPAPVSEPAKDFSGNPDYSDVNRVVTQYYDYYGDFIQIINLTVTSYYSYGKIVVCRYTETRNGRLIADLKSTEYIYY